jgi:hypothetical protein
MVLGLRFKESPVLQTTTFGNRPCAIHLARLLDECDSPSLTRRVTNFLITRNRLIKALEFVPGRRERLELANMLKCSINATKLVDCPEIVESFAKNVAISHLRDKIFDTADLTEDSAYGEETSYGEEFEFDDSIRCHSSETTSR